MQQQQNQVNRVDVQAFFYCDYDTAPICWATRDPKGVFLLGVVRSDGGSYPPSFFGTEKAPMPETVPGNGACLHHYPSAYTQSSAPCIGYPRSH